LDPLYYRQNNGESYLGCDVWEDSINAVFIRSCLMDLHPGYFTSPVTPISGHIRIDRKEFRQQLFSGGGRMNKMNSSSKKSSAKQGWVQLLFLVLVSSIFLEGFFPEIAMRTSEVMRDNPINTINLARVVLVGFVGFCTIGIAIMRIDKFVHNIRGSLRWMIVYAAVALASTFYSSLPLVSAGKALEVLVDAIFFVAVSSFCSSLEIVSLWNLLLSFLSVSLAAVWVSAFVNPSAGFIHIPGALLPPQLQGAFPTVSPNDLGEYSAIVAATAFYRMLARRRTALENEGLLWGGVFVVGLVSLIFAQARTSVVALAAALIAILFMTRETRLLPIFAVCGVALIAGGAGAALREYYMRGQSSQVFFTMTGRLTVWEVAWNFFKESPFLGHGFYTAHRLDLNARLSSMSIEISNIDNTFLEMLLGVGLIGLLPILAALFTLAGRLLRILRATDLGGRVRQCRCEIVGALIIVLIRAANGPTFQDHSISLLILLISMAFVDLLINQQAARQRARLRANHVYRSLIVRGRFAHHEAAR
jgi:O-antigen ligase